MAESILHAEANQQRHQDRFCLRDSRINLAGSIGLLLHHLLRISDGACGIGNK
jgi:hypothetical protein